MLMPINVTREALEKTGFEKERQQKLKNAVITMISKSPEPLSAIYVTDNKDCFEFFIDFESDIEVRKKNRVLAFLESVIADIDEFNICYSTGSYPWESYGKERAAAVWQS